jgi:AcrR family transcriptional regulator
MHSTLVPRKTPRQARSLHTHEVILEATIQVLLQVGLKRLTTTRVAERAGVSVGSLYQYFPNKSALLSMVLRHHLNAIGNAVSAACEACVGESLSIIVTRVIHAFVDVKFSRPEVSQALYLPMAELDGATMVAEQSQRVAGALALALMQCNDRVVMQPLQKIPVLLSALVGATQYALERGISGRELDDFCEQLITLALSYLDYDSQPLVGRNNVSIVR